MASEKQSDATMNKKVSVKILRFDPSVDEKPRYETYTVPLVWENMSVLGLLVYITENIDPSLAYYYSCRQVGRIGRCGGCDIFVNCRGAQACVENAPKAGEEILIEPPIALGFDVIKDLVSNSHFLSDRDKFFIPTSNASHRFREAYCKAKTRSGEQNE